MFSYNISMDPVISAVQQNLDSLLSIPFVSSSVVLGLAFYGYKAGPELPSFVEELFENLFFKIFVGFLVLYMSTRNFMLSFVVSGVFVYALGMLKENFFNVLGSKYVPGNRCINQSCDNMTGGSNAVLFENISIPTEDTLVDYLKKVKKQGQYADTISNTIETAMTKSPYNINSPSILTQNQLSTFYSNLGNAIDTVYGNHTNGIGLDIWNNFQK